MPPTRSRFSLAAGLVLVTCIQSCGTQTTLDTTWKTTQAPRARFHKLVVLSVLKSPGKSRAFESAVVREVNRAGVTAIPVLGLGRLQTCPGSAMRRPREP